MVQSEPRHRGERAAGRVVALANGQPSPPAPRPWMVATCAAAPRPAKRLLVRRAGPHYPIGVVLARPPTARYGIRTVGTTAGRLDKLLPPRRRDAPASPGGGGGAASVASTQLTRHAGWLSQVAGRAVYSRAERHRARRPPPGRFILPPCQSMLGVSLMLTGLPRPVRAAILGAAAASLLSVGVAAAQLGNPDGPGQAVAAPSAQCPRTIACTYAEHNTLGPDESYRFQMLSVCGANCTTQYWVSNAADGKPLLSVDPVRGGGIVAMGRAA